MEDLDPYKKIVLETSAFQLLINPLMESGTILRTLKLQFTNDDHTAKFEDIICWLIWNSIAGHLSPVVFGAFWKQTQQEDTDGNGDIMVAARDCNLVVTWLTMIKNVFVARKDDKKYPNFNRSEWQKCRDMSIQWYEDRRRLKGRYTETIINIAESDLGDDLSASDEPFHRACLEAIESIQKSDQKQLDRILYFRYVPREEEGEQKPSASMNALT